VWLAHLRLLCCCSAGNRTFAAPCGCGCQGLPLGLGTGVFAHPATLCCRPVHPSSLFVAPCTGPVLFCRYRGSADAIRKNLGELRDQDKGITPACDYVILSGSGALQQRVVRHALPA
jgi:hypothetical protein